MKNFYQKLMVISSPTLSNICFNNFNFFESTIVSDAQSSLYILTENINLFWEVDFSPSTELKIFSHFTKKPINKLFINELTQLQEVDTEKYWVLRCAGEYLFQSNKFNPYFLDTIRDIWLKTSNGEEYIEDIWSSSKNPWDIYLKSLTPEQPTYLTDFIFSEFLWVESTKLFFAESAIKLSEKEIEELKNLFEIVALNEIGYAKDIF